VRECFEIGRRGEGREAVRAVEREIAFSLGGAVAPGPAEAGQRHALGHVLAVVPAIEVGLERRIDVRPDE
jgi:2-keto-4-pentenoate hydratase